MVKVGINGFGRIGKCVFLQLLNNKNFEICCLNATNIKITEIEDYLKYDSVHHYDKNFEVTIISKDEFKINHHHVKLFSDYDSKNLHWRKYGCEYLIDATGAYLTTPKCMEHDVDYVIMSAPSKDNTKTFIYGANHETYDGENIVSGSSCTTNCLAPVLKLINDKYPIENTVFTTIHASTASQYTVDIVNRKARTNRSMFNNIIPHTTGASSSVTCVLPFLKNKINGTSVRVPVSDVSLLDLNVSLEDQNVKLDDIKELFNSNELNKIVYEVNTKNLVSCDFMTTTTPSILDYNASIDMGNGNLKLMLWYDNEWSYSSQLIRLVEHMFEYNNKIKEKYYFENMDLENKGIVCRFDFNVPRVNGIVTDDFRITSAIATIHHILSQNPKYLIMTSHFGRPKGKDEKNSLKFLIPILENYIGERVKFLEKGICEETLEEINKYPEGIYLLENLRFHKEETDYEIYTDEEIQNNKIINLYKEFGDIFICDAFGCLHRKHMSIYGMKYFNKSYGFGFLIRKEINAIDSLIKSNEKTLGIIGGNKIKDKLPIINSLRKINNSTVFIAGGLAKQYNEKHHNVLVMNDGYGHDNLEELPLYIEDVYDTVFNIYDIGYKSMNDLISLINNSDTIFWNGSLGVIESEFYGKSSKNLVSYLMKMNNKKIIIGGGETASLFPKTEKNNIYISTGGGALLEYLQNKILNGKNLIGLDIYT